MSETTTEVKSTLILIYIISETIRELGSIPSGHLYAQLTGKLNLEQYERIINILKGAQVITESGHLLTWNVSAKKQNDPIASF